MTTRDNWNGLDITRTRQRHDMVLKLCMLANYAKQTAFYCQANPQLPYKTQILLRDLVERAHTIVLGIACN